MEMMEKEIIFSSYHRVPPIDVHKSIHKVKDLDPDDSNIRLLVLPRLEMHKCFGQQCRRTQTCLRHASGVSAERG